MRWNVDEWLRELLFRKFRIGRFSFDFLEGLLAVCITGAGFLLRTPFETGLPHWPYLLAEWYLGIAASVLAFRLTGSGKKALLAYGLLMILPTSVAETAIVRGEACIGALLLVSGLLFLERGRSWLFALVTVVLLLGSPESIGLLFACAVLWQREKLSIGQLLVMGAAGGARFVYSYRIWMKAGYTLTTFHWPNIYEIVGRESVQTQQIDPTALVGLFLALGLLVLGVYLFSKGSLWVEGRNLLGLFLFFGLAAGYFLPYMDQSFGYTFCILGVLYFLTSPGEFWIPMALQIAAFAGYQQRLNGESMMPMAVFAVLQLLVLAWLGVRLLQEAGVIQLWKQKN